MANRNPAFSSLLEHQLRQAVCIGNTTAIEKMLALNVDVNAREQDTGWTTLHFACKYGRTSAAALLLKNGADKNAKTLQGETPESLCSNPYILPLLGISMDSQRTVSEPTVHSFRSEYLKNDGTNTDSGTISKPRSNSFYPDDLVLKIRIADRADPDFIEIELPQNDLTYQALVRICCQELTLEPDQIVKLRKLPNTKLRKDEDIKRLRNFQEIEVVTNTAAVFKYVQSSNGVQSNTPIVPANGYQSISKKDQTILY